MAVGGEQNFDELLKRLSQVKSLPSSGQPFRTQQNIAGSQLRDAAGGAFRNTPSLANTVSQITQGNQAPTGVKGALHAALSSAPAKVLLNGLTVVDTPRRAVISTIKEIGDALDSDPKTKANFGDWTSQIKDPSFGWGRVRPGKGWGGRIEGFIGDVLLDPTTYLTFGAAVPIKATAKGAGAAQKVLKAGRVITAGAEDVALRELLGGTRTVAGREGRFRLAEAVRKYGGTADEVKAVAARGKSAVPEDIARALGLNKSGLYMFGSRVRLPGTSRLGAYMERGLVTARLGVMQTNVGKKLSYLYTPRGTGFTGDLSKWRADLASGRLSKDKVNMIFTALNGAEEARALGTAARADELRRVTSMFEDDPDMRTFRTELHKIIEQPDSVVLSPQQTAAKAKVEAYLDDVANRITLMMRQVEPGWTFDKITSKYVPHVLTDKARRMIDARLDEPWAQRLEQYLSVDVLDMKGNMQSRRIKAGLEDFLGSGKTLTDGSIDGINKAFREATGLDFDLFETDMLHILGGYADTVRGAVETTTLMRNLQDDDFVRVLQQSGHVDDAYIDALKKMIDDKWDVVAKNMVASKKAANNLRSTLGKTLGNNGSLTSRLLSAERRLMGKVDDANTKIAEAAKIADNLVPLLDELDTISMAQVAATEELSRLTVGGNAATALVKEQVREQYRLVQSLRAKLAAMSEQALKEMTEGEDLGRQLSVRVEQVERELREINSLIDSNAATLDALQQYGDSFGPELERIWASFRGEVFEQVEEGMSVDLSQRLGYAQTAGFKETDDNFNAVVQTVSNPFSTNYLAKPTGRQKGAAEGISDAWVAQVSTAEGTPEFELLNSIPDLGTRGGKKQRVSMGSTRKNARALTLDQAREIVVRGSIVGDNPEEMADAFYFLTLRELRASGLNAGKDAANQARAQADFARELIAGNTQRAKAWQTARKAIDDAAARKQEYQFLASERSQLGTTTVNGRKVYLSEEGQSLIPDAQKALYEAQNFPVDAELRNDYEQLLGSLDSILGRRSVSQGDIEGLSGDITQFLNTVGLNPRLREKVATLRDSVTQFMNSMVDQSSPTAVGGLVVGGGADIEAVGSLRQTLENFVQQNLISKSKIAQKQKELDALNGDALVVRANAVHQKAALSEQVMVRSLRDVGDVLVNYSVYHNARIAVDYVARILPPQVKISDALLRFAFAGSARQHSEYVKTFIQKTQMTENIFRKIRDEMSTVSYANRAGWLSQRLSQLSEGELLSVGQVMGDLSLVSRNVPRDIASYRPHQPQWSNVVKQVLDLWDRGWDNAMTQEISQAVVPEARSVNRVKTYGGAAGAGELAKAEQPSLQRRIVNEKGEFVRFEYGSAAERAAAEKNLSNLTEKTGREMEGAFSVQKASDDRIANLRRSSPEDLLRKIDEVAKRGDINPGTALSLKEMVEKVAKEVDENWKKYVNRLKEETGYSPAELNRMKRALKNTYGDSHGLAALWADAIKTKADGSTRSGRAIDDFFTHIFGDGDVLVSRGSWKDERLGISTGGVDNSIDRWTVFDEETGRLIEARNVEPDDPEFDITGKMRPLENKIKKIVREARQPRKSVIDGKNVRRSTLEQMAFIATRLEIDEDATVRSIMDRMAALDDEVRVARVKKDEVFEEIYKSRRKDLQREFDDVLKFLETDITKGAKSPDLYRHISRKMSHFGRTRDILDRKMTALQELVFSPEAGLQNVDSLKFGIDDLDNGKLALYRVRYLRGLAEDYRRALESVEEGKKILGKVRPTKAAKAGFVSDFDAFVSAYGGDPRKFGELVRWVEASQDAIRLGQPAPARPKGMVIPQRVANALSEIRRARTATEKLSRSLEYGEAREAHKFEMFLRELSGLNLDPQYYSEVSDFGYRYGINEERRLRSTLAMLAGGTGMDAKGNIARFRVHRAEQISFDKELVSRFMDGDGALGDVDILVRVDIGSDEIADKRAVVDFVRAKNKQKFQYRVEREQLRVEDSVEEVVVYTDLTGPVGTRTRYVYRLNDVSDDPMHLGGLESGIDELILDEPVYARYTQQRKYPVAGNTGVDRHYFAMRNNNPVTAIRYTEMTDDMTPNMLLVSGAGEELTKSADGLSSDDFHHLVDLQKTFVFYELPSQKRTVAQRLSEANLPPQDEVPMLRPEFMFGSEGRRVDNARLDAIFRAPQEAGSTRTNRLFEQLNGLRKTRNDLQKQYGETLNRNERQRILTELETVEEALGAKTRELNAGLPKARAEARAVAWDLWERFKNPDVVGFLLGKKNMDPDEAEELALSAWKVYVKKLKETSRKQTLGDGSTIEFNPFVADADKAKKSRDVLRDAWNQSEYAPVINTYNELNKRINAAVSDLDVVKNGGEAADLAARYVSALEQLRSAEMKLASAKANVGEELYLVPQAEALDAAKQNADKAGAALRGARTELKNAQGGLRQARSVFVPDRPMREAELRASRLFGVSSERIASMSDDEIVRAFSRRARSVVDDTTGRLRQPDIEILLARRQEFRQAWEARDAAIWDAEGALRSAQNAVAARETEVSAANEAVARARQTLETERLSSQEKLDAMTADEFDLFVEKEIAAIKAQKPTDFTVTVSQEQVAALRATQDELGKRRELLESLRPELQQRYQGSVRLVTEAERRYQILSDDLIKARKTLDDMEAAEKRGGGLAFGGRNYPVDYASAKRREQDALRAVRDAQKRLDDLTQQHVKVTAEVNTARAAGAETNTLMLSRDEAQGRLALVQNALDTLRRNEETGRPTWVKSLNSKDWDTEFDDVKNEIESVVRALNALPPELVGKDVDKVWATWTKYLESRAAILLSKDDWEQAVQLERLGAAGVLNSDNMIWKEVLDDGFVKLEGAGSAAGFSRLQMRPEVAEILGNMGRVKDGQFVRSMRRWMIPYTKFFKAWALATPGFHVRNSLTNGFMMIAAGGRPDFLYEAMLEYNAMHKFLKKGKTFEQYLDTITDAGRKQRVSAAINAMQGSGVGQAEEILFDTSSALTNNPITRLSRKAGVWVESHSRFMLAYDGIRQGYDVGSATARVRRFLFDYEDVSKLDATMRQIIPFWTWTSRNVPLTIQNIYANPRPYQIYQSWRRNFEDRERTAALPQYMREAGAFALPGTDLAVAPELGFNRLQADVSMLSDPMRLAANVNPLLRVPAETLLANKSFFRNREFQQAPLPVDGPVGTLASMLGQPIGLGQSQGGQRYVDERLLYGLTNMVPSLNQVERFIPSQEYYQQRGSTNPLLGMLGAPVRQVTPEMLTSEQRRRLAELQKLLASQPRPQEG